jgi:hypothetical protein
MVNVYPVGVCPRDVVQRWVARVNQMQAWDDFAWSWLPLAALSTVYVAVDQFRGNPEARVMKWGLDSDHPLPGADRAAGVTGTSMGTAY